MTPSHWVRAMASVCLGLYRATARSSLHSGESLQNDGSHFSEWGVTVSSDTGTVSSELPSNISC